MKRLLALLLLVVAPAFAQVYTPPTINDPVVQQTYTLQQSTTTSLQNVDQTGGTALTLYDDGTTYQPIQLPFDFYYFGNIYNSVYISQNGFISFSSNANGCCNGNPLPFLSEQSYYNLNNSIFAMWSDLADFNAPGNPYYKLTGNSFTVGWYGIEELGSGGYICDEFGGCVPGPGNKFTFEISLYANNDFSIAYGSFDYPNPTGYRTFTSGFQGDTANEFWQIYNGNDPTVLENKTYLFASSEIAPPQPPPPPEEPIAPDCTINPTDPTCIINTLIPDITDPIDEEILADEQTSGDDGSSDGTEVIEEDEEVLVADDTADEQVNIEEMLQDEEATDEEAVVVADETTETVSEPTIVVAYRELTDEEKAAILADAISKNTLEGALAIASETSSSSNSAAATTTTQSDSTSRSSTTQAAVAATVTESSTTIEMRVEEEKTEVVIASDAGADVLETGRLIGKEALAATTTQSEQSASESITQAESIAISSSENQTVVAVSNETTQTAVTEDTAVVASSKVEEVEDGKREVQQVASDESSSSSTAEIEQQIVAQSESNIEVDTNTVASDNTTEQVVEDKAESVVVADTSTTEQADTFAEIMQLDIKPVTEETGDKDVEFVQQLAATSNEQKQEETNNSGFSEDEKVTIANDPALVNAFNLAPNINNLEAAGVLNQKQEEKSDAEKRADEVVAANAKEQEDINKNYMDADQSGIVAAMGADTDVSAYRTAMLRDNNNWYKPEDIYKGIIIKDNVRGSYFLEKGNTDTYKKMIEEQYK